MVPLQGYPSGPPGPIIQSQPNSFVSPSVYQGKLIVFDVNMDEVK